MTIEMIKELASTKGLNGPTGSKGPHGIPGVIPQQYRSQGEQGLQGPKGLVGIKKAMFSQPMAGLTDEQIVSARETAIKFLEANGYEIVNTLFTDEWYTKDKMEERGVVQIPLCFLAKSLENMALCHAVYFANGWKNARGCRIEHDAAKAYGLEIIYEH